MPASVSRSRRRKLLAVGCALLLAWAGGVYLIGRIRAGSSAVSIDRRAQVSPAGFEGVLRVGCYNIAHGRGSALGASNWDGGSAVERRERLASIGHLLGAQGLDVVVLNEIDFSCVWSGHVDQGAVIAEAGSFPHVVRQRNVDVALPLARFQFGNAILSRYPVRSAELVRFAPYSRLERWLAGNHESVIARVELPDGRLVAVWGVHLEVRDKRTRRAAARKIVAIASSQPIPFIVAGDFNSKLSNEPRSHGQRSTALDILHDAGLFQSFPDASSREGGTFSTDAPERTIDWILTPRSWSVVAGQVVPAPYSDHLPVVATLRPPPPG